MFQTKERSTTKPSTKKGATAVTTNTKAVKPTLSYPPTASDALPQDTRNQMIAEAAYYLAERRGFVGGSPLEDWYAAEAQINSMLSGLAP